MKKSLLTKKSFWSICVAVCLMALLGISTAYASKKDNSGSALFQAGQIDRQTKSKSLTADTDQGSNIYMQGTNIKIYKDEVNTITKKNELAGVENSEEKAVKYLLKREVLYQQSIKNGFSATDQEVSEIIANNRNDVKKAVNYNDFLVYLEGANQTEDEYWDSQFESIKKDTVIIKYTDQIYQKFLTENNITGGTEEARTKWSKKLSQIVDELIAQENIKSYK